MRMIPSLLLAAATACISGAAIAAPAEKPVYEQLAVTPVPDMPEGDWDQLVTDVAHNRIYVSGEDGALMAAFNLETGALIASGGDVVSPHKVAFDPKTGHLLVAEGKDGTVKVLTTDFKTVASIPVGAKSDTGAIDLVFPARSADGQERWWVLDWKSNWLGPSGVQGASGTCGPRHYSPGAMARLMAASHYPLQAHLYLVALHRYLRWRLVDYDPGLHLGGYAYVFLRGTPGPSGKSALPGTVPGMLVERPPLGRVLALDHALGCRAQGDPSADGWPTVEVC